MCVKAQSFLATIISEIFLQDEMTTTYSLFTLPGEVWDEISRLRVVL